MENKYSTVGWSTSLGSDPIENMPTKMRSGVYLRPNTVVQMGITIGDKAVVGAMSFVNKDVPKGGKWYGHKLC